jgi:hypothetical protein
MKKVLNLLAVLVFTCAFASLAQAQATRTWVSGVGDDANPCSRTAPCKTFAGAISKTADCGEIDALDPGGFGAVTITKAITIDGTGTMAGILASLTTGVIINAATDKVITLRGLSINGACNGIRGINILQAKTVNIEDCVIFRFAGDGITASDNTSGLNLNVRNTVIRDNTGDGINAVSSAASPDRISLDNVRLSGNTNGIHARSGATVSAHNSVFSNNSGVGVFADNTVAASFAVVRVRESQITSNGTGVRAGSAGGAATSLVEISQNLINFNAGNGVQVVGAPNAIVETFQNNDIQGNGPGGNGCPGCTPAGPGQ